MNINILCYNKKKQTTIGRNNDLNIKEPTKLIGVSGNTWGQWERGKFYVSRITYPKLKELSIL